MFVIARFLQGRGLNFVALQEQLQSDNVKKKAHRDEKSRLLLNQHFLFFYILFSEFDKHDAFDQCCATLQAVLQLCKSTSDGGNEEPKARNARLS